MYTREEKIEITEAFLKSGLTAKEAERRPGWPCRKTLSEWVKQAESGNLPVVVPKDQGHVKSRKKHGYYSTETKARAVALYERGRRPVEIEKLLGLSDRASIRRWWQQAQETGRLPKDDFTPKPYNPSTNDKELAVKHTSPKDLPPEVAELTEAEMENACLRAVLADLKVEGFDLLLISNKRKVELGEKLRADRGLALRKITDFLKISKSSYEYHRVRLNKVDKYSQLRARIREIFFDNNSRYGYRRIWRILKEEGICVSEKVVRRIMYEESFIVRFEPKRKRWSSYKGELSYAPENLVCRNFHAALPNSLWLTDITEFSLPTHKCYLSAILDCFDGKIVSWKLLPRPTSELSNSTLDDAIATLSKGEYPIIHSDRGSHYRWPSWVKRCQCAGLIRSMSAKGCSPDNSAMEGFFGRLKNEFFYHKSWEGCTFESFKSDLGNYIEWYNTKRIKQSLGWMSPEQFRISLGLAA